MHNKRVTQTNKHKSAGEKVESEGYGGNWGENEKKSRNKTKGYGGRI